MFEKGFLLRGAIIVAMLVLAASLVASCGGKKAFSMPPTTLSSPRGEVLVSQQGSIEWTEASEGMDIGMGDCVKTGSDGHALMIFFEGSVMEIEEDTQICIEDLGLAEDTGSTFIKLWQQIGRTINRVEQLTDPASRYEVETPAGSSVVRGTFFEVEVVEGGTTTLKTFSGEASFCVEGEPGEEGECVLVPLGMQITTEPGSPPGELTLSTSDLPPPPEEPAPPSEDEDEDEEERRGKVGGGGGGGWVPPATEVSELTLTKSADKDTANVGETITYSFTVTNTGDVTINGISLSDPMLGTITLDKTSLAPGETAISTEGPYTHTVVEDDLPGPLTNTASAEGTDSQGDPVSNDDSASVELTLPRFSITIDSITGGGGGEEPYTNPISLAGWAYATQFPGQLDQYHVQIDWGDGEVDTDSFTDFVQPDPTVKNFEGPWLSDPSHSYATGGIYTITVILYHGQPSGAESGEGEAVVTIVVSP